MVEQNKSLWHIKEDVEQNRYSLQNVSDMLSDEGTERQNNTAAIQVNKRLSQLALDINTTKDLHQNLESRVLYIEGNTFYIYDLYFILFCLFYHVSHNITKISAFLYV